MKMADVQAGQVGVLSDGDRDKYINQLQQARQLENLATSNREEANSMREYVAYLITTNAVAFTEDNRDPYVVELLNHAQQFEQKAVGDVRLTIIRQQTA